MITFLFECDNPLRVGNYLLGSPKWSSGVSLVNARLTCTAGSSTTPTVLQLEVNGVLVDRTIPVMPRFAGQKISLVVRLNKTLPAGAELRVKCVSGPAEAAMCIRNVGLNLSADDAGSAIPSGDLWVKWVDGPESFRLFDYNPANHLFTESSAGISMGRATIDNATTLAITIKNSPVARCNSSQQFLVNEVVCNGATTGMESPRLEFFIGNKRVAALTGSGTLYVLDLEESASITGITEHFEFYGAGVLSAILGAIVDGGASVLSAVECVEPV